MVLHFSILAFMVNLMSVPQMASITAHEKMSAYAYIGMLDGLLRLGVAFMILKSPIDRLVYYAMLMAAVVLIVRLAYGIYCRVSFQECRYRMVFDKSLVKEMFSFAGWNFIGVTSGVLRDHGGNILVNLFSGPVVNAARGVAVQLNGAVQSFVTNFMTAVNPQITKSYAAGDEGYAAAFQGVLTAASGQKIKNQNCPAQMMRGSFFAQNTQIFSQWWYFAVAFEVTL